MSSSIPATHPPPPLAGLEPPAPRRVTHEIGAEAWEREQLLDRLRSLRRVLPALAQEMATARRQAARLRADNRRLSEQVRRLHEELEAQERKQI